MIGSGRGGGGGFGSFPYRSSHQQGQDGPNRRGRGRDTGRGNNSQRRSRNNSSTIQSQLNIPSQQRKILVGRGGSTLNWLKEVSGANIFVPFQNNRENDLHIHHPVRVNSSDLPSLLHALYEIVTLLSKSSDFECDHVECQVKMRTKDSESTTNVDGRLFIHKSSMDTSVASTRHELFMGMIESSQHQFRVYTIETEALDVENISTIVDNIRFVDSSVDNCQWICREALIRNTNAEEGDGRQTHRRIIFIF
jgi:hypothetical protein